MSLRRLLKVLIGLTLLMAAVVALAPFLIDQRPLATAGDSHQPATTPGQFLTIPFPGTDGLDIHYLDAGSEARGPVFLLLHGFTLNAFTWGPVLEAFAVRGRAIAYDQPPYGLSAKPAAGDWTAENPYAKESAIAQLFAVMDGLGVERAILVGSSSGGTLALEAALARPERVQALILVAPWVFAQRPTLPRWLAELPQLRRVSLLIARKLGDQTLLRYSYRDPARINSERESLARVHASLAGWDLAWGELLNRSLSTPVDVGQRLAEVRQPTLLITGDTDKLVPPADTERVAAALRAATLVTLPDCGHVPQEECPGPFIDAVGTWLKGLDQLGPVR
jgi:pimeloyl-ACP methyl ester carboxylesterase